MNPRTLGPLLILLALAVDSRAQQILDPQIHHLRHGPQREWDDFPAAAQGDLLKLTFAAKANLGEFALRLRQRDLRYTWRVSLNGKEIGKLLPDDLEIVTLLPIPPGTLRDGDNQLLITAMGAKVAPGVAMQSDDVFIGDIALIDQPRAAYLSQCTLQAGVVDQTSGNHLPAKLTIVDARGALVSLGGDSTATTAVRPGVVYTLDGRAQIKLPPGRYTVIAGRGFEYGIDSKTLDLAPAQAATVRLAIARQVDTAGYVAADTHIHTGHHARHGDATVAQRMITLAGEAVELPVSTEHNLAIDFDAPAREANGRQYFTPVLGMEVTTPRLGHFNVFPIDKTKLPDFRATSWPKLFDSFDKTLPGGVVILNHARDIHGGFRPFDPARHLALTGEDLDGWDLRINACEVLNSSAMLPDSHRLFYDWMGLLNAGKRVAPIGASDCHDVCRYLVGQGRTYVKVADTDPGHIDTAAAVAAIAQGRVLVSYGLYVDMTVNGQSGVGDLAKAPGDTLEVKITVQGPAWTRADRVALFANGQLLKQATIEDPGKPGVKWSAVWRIPRPKHDVFLTALATGPGITTPHWPNARPYQPTTPAWKPYVFACTGAIYIDADGSGTFESARDLASAIFIDNKSPVYPMVRQLADYDAAVAMQFAAFLRIFCEEFRTPERLRTRYAKSAAPHVAQAFKTYADAWEQSLNAQAQAKAADEKAHQQTQRRQEIAKMDLHASQPVFSGDSFPAIDFDKPARAREILGDYTLKLRFFDSCHQPVTQPDSPGRYGAVVEIISPNLGKLPDRLLTLYKSPAPLLPDQPRKIDQRFWAALGVDKKLLREQRPVVAALSKDRTSVELLHDPDAPLLLGALYERSPGQGLLAGRQSIWAIDQRWWQRIKKKLGLTAYRFLAVRPDDYNAPDNSQRYPLVLYLHGQGECGDDLDMINTNGLPALSDMAKKLGFLVLAPQCPSGQWWSADQLIELLDTFCKSNRVDPSRIYLTGLSMGGYGAWELAAQHPDRFAAIAPICGGSSPADAAALAKIPAWIFHGVKDDAVPVRRSQEMHDALQKAGANVKLTLYPNARHDAWTPTYDNPEFYQWLLSQRRSP